MAFEQKDNSAALFQNDKGDNPNRPDYRGNGMVNGKLVQISGWVKESKSGGKKFLSLSFQDPKPASQPTATATDGEGLPF